MRKSPFPGMDPFLEASWRDVHHSLCTYARDDLQAQLGDGMFARVDERLMVELSPEQARAIYPDIRVIRRRSGGQPPESGRGGGTALAEPIIIEFEDETPSEAFIEIIDPRSGGRVITVIEFLSVTNKMPGPGRDAYQQKQRELRAAGVSSVEVNLVRAGPPLTGFPYVAAPPEKRTAYHAVVHHGWEGNKYYFYPFPLRERLPAIAIPLRQTDAPIALDLQSLIDRVYRNGAYGQEIDYNRPLLPPLEKEEAECAAKLLNEAGVV